MFGFATHARAQTPPAAIDRQNQIIERQQQDQLREEQDRTMRARPPPGGTDLQDLKPQVSVPELGAPCREIREIRFGGDTQHLPSDLKHDIENGNAGRCLGGPELEGILAAVTKSYIDRGYITTRAYLPAQDLRSGILEVTVVEGRIERFELIGGRDSAQWIRGAFPVNPGDLLNLRDLEQGINQINSLSTNNAKLDLRPGSEPGQTVVGVENPAAFPVHAYVSLDNSGTRATGVFPASATVSFDSVLGLNELLSITKRQSVLPKRREHNSDSIGLRAVLPFGYNTFSLDTSQSGYTNVLHPPSGLSLVSEGRTVSKSLTADRVVYRDQASRISLSARLGTQSTRNWLGGEYLQVSSRTLSTLDWAASAFTQVGGGILNARFSYVEGLTNFGALRDADDRPDDLPHAQFRKLALDLGFSRGLDIAGRVFQWSSQFSGQHAYDTLYGAQQILIGGNSSVRGFLDSVLSGDNGFYLRNELSIPGTVATIQGAPLSVRTYAGLDAGRVSNRAAGVPSGSLSGATLGTALQWKTLNLDVFAARAVHMPSALKREGTRYSFRLSASR
ncbi:ShlB/FhaC/HecB family hemolysin secretion/activation protein [Verminephrobacter aporrectodeae subsp. tuberculatae]|uniref:ShlB/FhaC/HecB family hemolysin secretion/activation protein n=2 Tax=Verminephrobacter TaxID=364316 RepID=A0ABT3KWW9_9BURK|nr:ShlB/FhaC/HecB family hemolysin secretion/activation protein [Verminephrobacter aporrectodeae subsp. tuberculatae]